MVFLTLLLIFVGGAIGGKTGMIYAFVFASVMNFVSYWFSHKIVLAMYGAKPVTEAQAPELHSMIRRLTQKAGIPMPKVYVIQSETPNAFATGRNPEHGVVALTDGIVRLLSREELEGVIAHELAHIRHRDILTGTIVATIAGAISMLAQMAHWAMLFGGGRRDDGEGGGSPIVALVMMIVAPIAAMLVQMAISRTREYEADAGGARLAGNPYGLANALLKLERGAQAIPMNANPATAHMFIVNPLTGGGVLKLFSTHPPVSERVRRLKEMARGA